MDIEGALAIVSFFGTIFVITYFYYITRHRERMALIEKGADASIFYSRVKSQFSSLKYGIVCVGIALGILIGHVLQNIGKLPEPVAFFSMIFLFGGLSLIAFYLIAQKSNKSIS